ncbi:6021_t:CDS:2, partial [Ambispora leptoticha]
DSTLPRMKTGPKGPIDPSYAIPVTNQDTSPADGRGPQDAGYVSPIIGPHGSFKLRSVPVEGESA